MANNSFPYTPALKAFQDADDAWGAELRRTFGRRAGDARYSDLGKGEGGTTLRQLHDTRESARVAWHRTAA